MNVLTKFELPESFSATEPPEARGISRDQVRLLVSDGHTITHGRFADLPRFLHRGDLLVANDSATLAAAVDGRLADGRPVTVHFATELDDGTWVVEVRPAVDAAGPVPGLESGDLVHLPARTALTLLDPYPDAAPKRLWTTDARNIARLLKNHGRPITYGYVPRRWPLADYQTIFGVTPGSAEMPSAGRPFTPGVLEGLRAEGVSLARITLHTGVSSPESGEPPSPERFVVPAETALLVNSTHDADGRVIAVGTTATRALESVADTAGRVSPGTGWTHLILGPDRPARTVGGLITGWHAPGASHLLLLEAVAGAAVVGRAYQEALANRYLWHEFGDSALLLAPRRTQA
ncbi:S-adenosylmethionine:tRNA ribosyltransferase-isomerase [Arthrobacter sp. H5]|uniref:S-adenosylmethionine:tRNA ribosyltransferase-isomerase n=1 Tax=Arthrobacter sp. H5 TaxID=1267973 RepID=UPI000482B176|nr:S-adenosylmethionine:tRNA ribosyltransferase-isomerase [Arthrobacter sp. H5]